METRIKTVLSNRWVVSALWLIGLIILWEVKQVLGDLVNGSQNLFIGDDIVLPFVFGVYLSLVFLRLRHVRKRPVILVVWLSLTLVWSYQLFAIYFFQFIWYPPVIVHSGASAIIHTEPSVSPSVVFQGYARQTTSTMVGAGTSYKPMGYEYLGAASGFFLSTALFAKNDKRTMKDPSGSISPSS